MDSWRFFHLGVDSVVTCRIPFFSSFELLSTIITSTLIIYSIMVFMLPLLDTYIALCNSL
jgi:hypothetical protein